MNKLYCYLPLLSGMLCGTPCLIKAQWNTGSSVNTPVSVAASDQQDPRPVSDGKGGSIIVWADYRDDDITADVYAQRLDAGGFPKWTLHGVPVAKIPGNSQTAPFPLGDGTGGAIIVWQDWRNGNRDIYVQRIDSTGNALWTSNGVQLTSNSKHQEGPRLISDGAQGAIIVWQDSSNGLWDIHAQRIDAAGNTLWTSGGVVICNAMDQQINPRIVSDDKGGAIIAWQDKRSGNDYDIYAQRISATGSVKWAANGVGICTLVDTQNNPKIESDGNGGAIIVWADKRDGIDFDVYAQRIDSTGILKWTTYGVAISTAAGNQSAVDMTTDNVDGAIISWKDSRFGNTSAIYAQRVNANGTVQWTTNGIPLAANSTTKVNPNAIGDGQGGAIITWQDSTVAAGWDVYAQRVNAAGLVQWTNGGVPAGNAAGSQTSPKNVSDGNGGAIFTWQDKRNGNDFDIYAHHLYANGSPVGVPDNHPVSQAVQVYPNPAVSMVNIHVAEAAGKTYRFILRDLMGRELKSILFEGNSFQFRGEELPRGIYLTEILCENNSLYSGKLVIP